MPFRPIALLLACAMFQSALADERAHVNALADRLVQANRDKFPVSFAFSGLPIDRHDGTDINAPADIAQWHEMIEDPMFHENPVLEDVAASRTATSRLLCNGDTLWTLPDGREVYVPSGEAWPDISGEQYWEEEVDEVPPMGAPIVLVNNTEAINGLLAAYNAQVGWDGSAGNGGAESGGGDEGDASGCGCRGGGPAGAVWALGLLLGVAFLRRRSGLDAGTV